jgi:threonine synthase
VNSDLPYVSTRGESPPASFTQVALAGLAPDGGLYVPAHIPEVTSLELAGWRHLDYPALARAVLGKFISDLDSKTLGQLLDVTYTATHFGTSEITPLSMLSPKLGLLHLSNGPTLAFKDIAMQWLGALFEHLLLERGGELNILGATSGDTGSAALHAMAGKARIRVFMLSPLGKMSPFQAAQMYALDADNCVNLAVRGVFDEAQDIVKEINRDLRFKERYAIGTVNSINWARLVAQVVYYFKGYFAATASNRERISFCVPSGNFGNLYAGHLARRMGLPIAKLVCATNENDVLHEFFKTGTYRPRAPEKVEATSSPSMDISRASNFERLIFDLYDGDASALRQDWDALAQHGEFTVSGECLRRVTEDFGFVSGRSTHDERIATIREVHARFGICVDPHTAAGLAVAMRGALATPMIALETAQPAKFESTMIEALGFAPPRPARFEGLEHRPQHVKVIDATTSAVRAEIEATC